MTAPSSVAGPSLRDAWAMVRAPVPALLLGLALLGLAFHAEAAAAYRVWMESTAYSHCFFVLPIAAYMAWERRHALASVPVAPAPWAVALVLPLGVAWLAAERLGIMEGRQLVAVAILEVLFLAVLGWRMFQALAAPLLYLFFLVPFGAFLTPALQDFTAVFIDVGLDVLRIPHFVDAYIIEIPAGRFYVAEACAGLRFLIASIAFGVLYSVLMYRSIGRRVAFIAASIVIPIIANGMRALGIVVLGHVLGSAEAAAADHILYGWLFFSVVILLLIVAGLPFRQDLAKAAPAPAAPPAVSPWRPALAAGLVGAVALAGPAVSAVLDRAAETALEAPAPRLTTPRDCRPAPLGAVQSDLTGTPGATVLGYACPQGLLTVVVQVFPAQSNPARVISAQRRATGEFKAEEAVISSIRIPGMEPDQWRLVTTYTPASATATALWVDGRPAKGGIAGRMLLAHNSVFGTAHAPVLVAVGVRAARPQMTPEEDQLARHMIANFLVAQTALPAEIARLSSEAASRR
ncbi:exosortase A [Limobrevibacterium gyesilva]|uniref:Exosortase n=1 Tax=Limobrevibacterium gyesilva TaxID=2991712 RepID=A0AA41YX22_9PROT|nr:exosortase A [Limobrevibacterium gyesilva]MCW3476922.1 exosortase [Limobrevibacterium gyesilva]